MRKSLWIILAVMVVAVGAAPNAHADTFTYSYTDPTDGISWTTNPIPGITSPDRTVLAADLASTSNTGKVAGCTTTSVVLAFDGPVFLGQRTNFDGPQPPNCPTFVNGLDFNALSDYTTPGVYLSSFSGNTLTVTAVTAPEPSSAALMLLGVGLALLLRKRRSPDGQLAT